MSLAYRGLDHVVAARLAELAERRSEEIAMTRDARAVYARRVGRLAFGVVGGGGALALFACVALRGVLEGKWWGRDVDGWLTYALVACWGCGALAYVAARWAAAAHARGTLRVPFVRTADAVRDLARLELFAPGRILERLAAPLEGWSAALPLAALSFLTPLTIHLAVGEVLARGDLSARSFDEWISVSVVIVGHAHLVLAICALRYGRKLAVRETADLVDGPTGWGSAFGWTMLAGTIPGIIFFAIPPMLVAATGLAFIPAMFIVMTKKVARERGALEAACA